MDGVPVLGHESFSPTVDPRDPHLRFHTKKKADVCYSWWILSALCILGRLDWIDTKRLQVCTYIRTHLSTDRPIDRLTIPAPAAPQSFILQCQDQDDGGIADRPGNVADVFHTFFGIAGLALLGYFGGGEGGQYAHYRAIDPVYALPADIVAELGIKSQVVLHKGEASS